MATVALTTPLVSDTASERLQNGLAAKGKDHSLSRGTTYKGFQPQISVEQADGKISQSSSECPSASSAHPPADAANSTTQVVQQHTEPVGDKFHLQVAPHLKLYGKSASLPMGATLDKFSDGEVASVDSSAYNSSLSGEDDAQGK